jgi:hypothetical protein
MPTPLRRRSSRVWGGLCQVLLLDAVVTGVVLALLAVVPARAQQEGDPPAEVARVSVLVGNVSVEPASVDQFSVAKVNAPLTTGDRIYTDGGANAELETGLAAVRMGQQTDLTVTAMTDPLEQFGLAQGSVHLRSFALPPGTTVELDTPNVAVTMLQRGDVRVDVDAESGTTTVELVSGEVQVDGNGFQQVLDPGQRVQLTGSDPVVSQSLDEPMADGLDAFSSDRDQAYQSGMQGGTQGEDAYVNADTIGAEDLNGNGDWETDPDEGAVWYPAGVAVGWVPYSCGSWTWVAPWGWTWVDCAPWGFAPFHYGRWEHHGNRWGWIPGPAVVRPIYSPAMVAFVGGPGVAAGGAGVTAWFALGPHDAYVPWYHASPRYVNRVNTSSIQDANVAEVRSLYNQTTLASAYASAPGHAYVNRPLATVAVAQTSFAAGKPVAQSAVHVSAEALAGAPVLPHPLVTPQRTMVVGAAVGAVPARSARPELASRTGEVAGAQPAAQSAEPGKPAAVVRPQAAPDTTARPQAPAVPATAARPLFHQATPPPPRPSFDEQQKAIETTDPGRPLGPQQMENLRQNRPAGPPQQTETPHPAPAARPSPPPRPPEPHPPAPHR